MFLLTENINSAKYLHKNWLFRFKNFHLYTLKPPFEHPVYSKYVKNIALINIASGFAKAGMFKKREIGGENAYS